MKFLQAVFFLFASLFAFHSLKFEYLLKNGYYKNKVVEMTKHAYSSYINNAYPADELMPLKCTGRYRLNGTVTSYDEYTYANLSATLVDSLDTLAIMNLYVEFEDAIQRITRDLKFDCDAYSSSFEINIRIIGGLISGHLLALELKKKHDILSWYSNELLDRALKLGNIVMNAFYTDTEIPYRFINLKKQAPWYLDETNCAACAGTYILEFGALSYLSNDNTYLHAALKALNFLWISRDKDTGLVGSTINIKTGKWTNTRSSIGTEIDSYYEYLLKSYMQFGSYKMLERFETHYVSISKHLKHIHMFLDVNLRNMSNSFHESVDSLRAFFPAIQVMYGEVEDAIVYHQILWNFTKKHIFLPETFSYDYKLIDHHYKQRPEFIESTYYLYQATQDPFYLDVAVYTIENFEKYLRVPCGYASIRNLSNLQLEDKMETFIISETFKYLYLMFASPSDLPIDLNNYVMSTEAHFMPIIGSFSKAGSTNRTCPNARAKNYFRDVVSRLWSSETGKFLKDVIWSNNIVYIHKTSSTTSIALDFMNLSIKLAQVFFNIILSWTEFLPFAAELLKNRTGSIEDSQLFALPVVLQLKNTTTNESFQFTANRALFGPNITRNTNLVDRPIVLSDPADACSELSNNVTMTSSIFFIRRGTCPFIIKVKNAQLAGAVGVVIIDNIMLPPNHIPNSIYMSPDPMVDQSTIVIPSVFVNRVQNTVVDQLVYQREVSPDQLTATLVA